MLAGKRDEDWSHTAQLLAWMGNTSMTKPAGKTFQPSEFNPYEKQPEVQKTTMEEIWRRIPW